MYQCEERAATGVLTGDDEEDEDRRPRGRDSTEEEQPPRGQAGEGEGFVGGALDLLAPHASAWWEGEHRTHEADLRMDGGRCI